MAKLVVFLGKKLDRKLEVEGSNEDIESLRNLIIRLGKSDVPPMSMQFGGASEKRGDRK